MESNRANAYARLATIHSETGQGKAQTNIDRRLPFKPIW